MLTWASAQDYRQPGLLSSINNAWPSDRGYISAGGILNDTSATFANQILSGVSAIRPDGTFVGFCSESAATSRIRLFSNGSDVSRVGAYAADTYFCYAPTADFCYATNGTDPLQRISLATLGTFADVANCPRFKIIITAGNRLWGFNTTANITYAPFTYNANGSRWWVSALGNFEDFVPSVASGAATDVLDDQDGEITAAIEFNGYPLVFKRSAIYTLEDDGAFVVERKIHSEFGCDNRDAVVKVDNRVYFFSNTNGGELCMYDGNTVVSLSRGIISDTYVGDSATSATGSGGNVGASIGTVYPTQLATNGRYVLAAQRKVPIGSGGLSVADFLVFDTVTRRFGRNAFSTGSQNVPQAIWTSANTSNIVCVYTSNGSIITGGIVSPNANATDNSSYTIYREQPNGAKALVNSGKVYFMGPIPTMTVTTSGTIPTGFSSAAGQIEGRWSHAGVSAQRHEISIIPNGNHEILNIEVDIASGGIDQSKPRGKM